MPKSTFAGLAIESLAPKINDGDIDGPRGMAPSAPAEADATAGDMDPVVSMDGSDERRAAPLPGDPPGEREAHTAAMRAGLPSAAGAGAGAKLTVTPPAPPAAVATCPGISSSSSSEPSSSKP